MPRTIWKGAVSFGLVHIPVAVVPATRSSSAIDFDWLDRRSMDPVGYKRVNKVTGEELEARDIVKGVQYEKGRYVVLSDEEIRAAHPKATRTVDILSFVDAKQISSLYLDTPYYLLPDKRGEKVYGLLREALTATGKVAVANVVLRSKQHLALIMPLDGALVLDTLRWADDVSGVDSLELKPEVLEPELSQRERDMAVRLVEGMSEDWEPQRYHDSFQAQIMRLVEQKAEAGKVEEAGVEEEVEAPGAEVIDLTELLRRSLAGPRPRAGEKAAARGRRTTRKAG